MLQFTTEGLDLSNQPDVINEIFTEITKLVTVSDITGLQLIPKRWPHRLELLCANEKSKDILQEKGLTIQSKFFDLSEPGQGKVKVFVHDAPLDLSNSVLRDLLNEYGKVLDVRNQYLFVGGNQVPWWNGTRQIDMCNVKSELPQTLNVSHGHKEVKIKIWHQGPKHIECRWCKEHIIRDEHNCPKKPEGRCYNCGSLSHLKSDCEVGKQCFTCGEGGHVARECPHRPPIINSDIFPSLPRPENMPESHQSSERVTHETVQYLGPPCADSPEVREPHDKSETKSNVKCLLLGSSNRRGLVIHGDDDLQTQATSYVTGGFKIKDAATKLNDIQTDELNEYQAVILHVGTTDFPVSSEKDFDNHYMQYVENLSDISTKCPKAAVLISSVLPTNEQLGTKTNRQIRLFIGKLKALAEEKANLIFVDNDSYLADGDQIQSSFYRKNDKIHLSTSGKIRLAEMLKSTLKEVVYRIKLENEFEVCVK